MIAQLIAIGVLSAGSAPPTGAVTVPEERTAVVARVQLASTIAVGIPLGAVEWEQPFDPADHAPYAFDWSSLLDAGERVEDILAIRVSSSAAALGIMVDQTGAFAPIIDSAAGLQVQLWFVVAEEMQEVATFVGAGVKIPVTMKIETSSTPPKRFERTNVLEVRQL